MFKISVIIPMYNDEKYLEDCIGHIIDQTLSFEENIQLILVDDNSKDNSYKIAKEYEEKYPNNIITAITEKNSGSGGKPRNIGIDLATGKYLMFSDADDYFDLNAFEIMYNAIEEKGADFVTSNWNFADENGIAWENPVFDLEKFDDFKLDIKDYENTSWVMNSSMCNKIFNREFICKNNIKCLEDIPGEDTYFSMNAFLKAKNVYYIKDIIYYYRQRNSSLKTASTSWSCSKKFFLDMSKAYKATYNLFVEHKQMGFYRFVYARNMTNLLFKLIDSKRVSDEEKIEVFEDLRWFFKLSKIINVPAVQKSVNILINTIIKGEFGEAINICKIIGELRTYMSEDVKRQMAKPYKEMYSEILKNPIENMDNIKKVQ